MKYVIFSALLALAWACSPSNANEVDSQNEEVKSVQTVAAERAQDRHTVFATGQLSAKEEANLSFKTGGIIQRILVQEGQRVRKGQLLAELDLDEIRAQAQQSRLGEKQAEIQLNNARLAYEKAQRDFENTKGLYEDSVATEEQYKDALTLLNNTKNQVEAAEAALAFAGQSTQVADFNLRYSRITAPSDGIILRKLAEVNELAGPGKAVFLFGSREKAQVVRVNITDKDIIYLNLGDSAEVRFDAYPDQVFRGVVREIASKADPYTNTFEVEVEVFPVGRRLFSGFIGQVRILTDRSREVTRIPVGALISADGEQGLVYVEKNGRVQKRPVRILRLAGAYLLIREGLQPGESVVVRGGSYLEDNDSIFIGQQ